MKLTERIRQALDSHEEKDVGDLERILYDVVEALERVEGGFNQHEHEMRDEYSNDRWTQVPAGPSSSIDFEIPVPKMEQK